MLSKYRYKIYLCLVVFIIIAASGLNAVYDPFNSLDGKQEGRFEHSARIPILMYHHFADDGDLGVTISAGAFENQMKALHDAGNTAISFEELRDYVYNGAPLPERPVIITMDDGYMSVYETAFPILKKYNMKATSFIIGVFYGQSTYKNLSYVKIIPHFGDAEALEMAESGLISIQSHSYDMHQYALYEGDTYRDGAQRRKGESRADYIEAFTLDFEHAADQIVQAVGARPFVYSYPFGRCSRLSESLLKEMGVQVTLTTVRGVSTVVKNAPQSLYKLDRINVPGDMTPQELLGMIG